MFNLKEKQTFKNYLSIARPDHWFKNIFILPGIVLAIILSSSYSFQIYDLFKFTLGIFIVCLIASANYTINEFLDAEFDKLHPTKKYRPAALGLVKPKIVLIQYIMLSTGGVSLSIILSYDFMIWNIVLLLMGILYNVKPFRTKDKLYLDVLSEAINNPIRFMLGWHLVILDSSPPISVLIGYWMGGAFLMSVKRLSEYRTIQNPSLLAEYRASFRSYTEESLLISSLVYALSSCSAIMVLLLKYKIEFVLCFPLYIAVFAWYLKIGLQQNSIAQTPEKLYRSYNFIGFVFLTSVLTLGTLFINIPILDKLIIPMNY